MLEPVLKSKLVILLSNPVPIDAWSISLKGTVNEQLTRANFESLATGNRLTSFDASGTWSGIALWRLLARVDDSDPTTFNDALAALGYTVKCIRVGFLITNIQPDAGKERHLDCCRYFERNTATETNQWQEHLAHQDSWHRAFRQ